MVYDIHITARQLYAVKLINETLGMNAHPYNKWDAQCFIAKYYEEAKKIKERNDKAMATKLSPNKKTCSTCEYDGNNTCKNPGDCDLHNSGYKQKEITCPHATKCINAGRFVECYGDYEDDEPCDQLRTMPEGINIVAQEQYAVGDKLLVRRDLKHDTYGSDDAVGDMPNLAGQFVTVTNADTYSTGLRIAESKWHWTPEMFEGKVVE